MEPRAVDNLPDATIAMTAWNWMLKLNSFDANQIRTFFEGHVGRGARGCLPTNQALGS